MRGLSSTPRRMNARMRRSVLRSSPVLSVIFSSGLRSLLTSVGNVGYMCRNARSNVV